MSSISVTGLTKRWGSVTALHGIDFEARAGELVILLGPSGCGKSTTLRIIAGLEEATSGRIRFGDRDVTALPAAQRGIAMVFQSYALYPHLSVRENIVFGLKVRRLPAAQRESRLERAAEILGIGKLLDRRPAELSGGQKQRVALGRAIVAQTPICLMDEPLSNLDAQLRQDMRTEIRALQRRLGMTMLYVTHDQTEAMTMADQVILMRDGRIEQKGRPADLYMRPATGFVARFVGTPPMNLLALEGAALTALESAVPVLGLPPLPRGGHLGVRPESLRLADAGLPALVATVEYLGADSIVLCEVGGQRVAVRVDGATDLAPGNAVRLAWRTEDTHLFGPDGTRLAPERVEVAA